MRVVVIFSALLALASAGQEELDSEETLYSLLDDLEEVVEGNVDADLDEAVEEDEAVASWRRRRHGHGPHGHGPHSHHRHSPHVHTPYPTPAPTPHICDTNQHNCAKTEGGVCYKPTDSGYANKRTDRDEGVNGVDEVVANRLDSNEWQIEQGTKYVEHNTNGNKYHAYKCGCREGYNCVAGCSPPFTYHQCDMTKYPTPYPTTYPTPYPTSNPTPAPTPTCPVTCEKDAGQFAGKKIYGHKGESFDQIGVFSQKLASLAGCDLDAESSGTATPFTDQVHGSFDPNPHHGCDWRKRRAGRIVSTHNVELVNEEDSFRKHRCYTYKGHCVCECLDNNDFYQDGTVQGKPAGLWGLMDEDGNQRGGVAESDRIGWGNAGTRKEEEQGHREAPTQQLEESITQMNAAGTRWKSPHYYIHDSEILALKECCAKELTRDVARWVAPVSSCSELQTMPAKDVRALVDADVENHLSNTQIVNFLHQWGCWDGQKRVTNREHFAKRSNGDLTGKQEVTGPLVHN